MFPLASRAIEPSLSLPQAVEQWESIAEGLAAEPRKQKPQLASFFS